MADQPKYKEIADHLRQRIRSGEFIQGDKLPTEEDLGDTYEASRNTIRRAVERLAREGLAAKRPGQGTYVAIKVDPFVTVLSTNPRRGYRHHHQTPASPGRAGSGPGRSALYL